MMAPLLAADTQGLYAVTSLVPAACLLLAFPLAILATARLHRWIPRVREAAHATPLRSFLVGVLVALALLLLLAASGANSIFGIPAILALVVSGFLALLGLAAEARDLGCALRDRDPAAAGTEGASTALGWLVLSGVPLVLLAGPLVLLYLALRSAGAATLTMATRPSQ